MPASPVAQRLSFAFLCSGPFLAILLVAIRLLRVPVVHEAIGIAVFAMFAMAIRILGFRGITSQQPELRLAAIAAALLILPFALISLFWVGLGPPWLASPAENQIRYLVLVTNAAAVVGGCISLKEALSIVGERLYSTLGFTGMILAGPFYMVGEAILLALFSALDRTGKVPEIFYSLSEFQDILLFFGGALTYSSAAVFSISLHKAGWLGRRASRAFAFFSVVALVCLVTRGLQFPDPEAQSMPWYTIPGFIVGVPAVPFIIPYFLGVVSLRQSNREQI